MRDEDRVHESITRLRDALQEAGEPAPDYPIRQKSANGQPAEQWKYARTCHKCKASFLQLAPGKTGERGIWTNELIWFCSQECADSR